MLRIIFAMTAIGTAKIMPMIPHNQNQNAVTRSKTIGDISRLDPNNLFSMNCPQICSLAIRRTTKKIAEVGSKSRNPSIAGGISATRLPM